MYTVTNVSYFQGENQIANTDQVPVQENLQLFIDEYESEYLQILLGPVLAAQFIAGITPVPVDPPTDPVTYVPIEQKWLDLMDQIWVIKGTSKVSPVANFIYFYFVRRATYYNSGTGLQVPTAENAMLVDSKIECARAWNKMNKLSFNVYKFLKANVSVYGPLPYDLRFYGDDCFFDWFDWSYWWGWFPFNYRRLIPEIYQPINAQGI